MSLGITYSLVSDLRILNGNAVALHEAIVLFLLPFYFLSQSKVIITYLLSNVFRLKY